MDILGVEPRISAHKTDVIPFHYTSLSKKNTFFASIKKNTFFASIKKNTFFAYIYNLSNL